MARPNIPAPPTHEEFVFWVAKPSVSYGFAIQHDRRRSAPFEESQALHFVTDCISPDRFKGRAGKATIYPEPALVDNRLLDEDDVRRKWIGYIRATKSEF